MALVAIQGGLKIFFAAQGGLKIFFATKGGLQIFFAAKGGLKIASFAVKGGLNIALGGLEIALAVQGGGEGEVVQGLGRSVGAAVRLHALDAVFCLVGRELALEFLGQDVGLRGEITLNDKYFFC